jgi:hypothetical protein
MSRQSNQGYQQLSVHSAATSLTVPQLANVAVITVENATVRMRGDGTAPTTTVGFPLATSTPFTYDGEISRLQLIATAGTATVNVMYFMAV